jgi:hypothetical protein
MSIKKRTTGAISAAATVGLGAPYAFVRAVDVTSSSDTSVSVAITDGNGDTVATIASADYTTRARFYIAPVETRVFDTAGDASADLEGNIGGGVIAESPLTITPSGVAAGTVTVDVFVEV